MEQTPPFGIFTAEIDTAVDTLTQWAQTINKHIIEPTRRIYKTTIGWTVVFITGSIGDHISITSVTAVTTGGVFSWAGLANSVWEAGIPAKPMDRDPNI